MNQEFKKKWVWALRSGEFKQGRNALFNGEAYCPLGVACVVAGLKPDKTNTPTVWLFDSWLGCLPPAVAKEMDITITGTLKDGNSIVRYNDTKRLTFNEIADIIEKDELLPYSENGGI